MAQDSHEAAVRVLITALDTTSSLDQYAERGRIVPELNQSDLRELFVFDYRLLYRVRSDEVVVVAYLHGARLRNLASGAAPPCRRRALVAPRRREFRRMFHPFDGVDEKLRRAHSHISELRESVEQFPDEAANRFIADFAPGRRPSSAVSTSRARYHSQSACWLAKRCTSFGQPWTTSRRFHSEARGSVDKADAVSYHGPQARREAANASIMRNQVGQVPVGTCGP